MAIDPTTPVTPIAPAAPAGTPPNSVVLQAMARAALAGAAAQLGEIAAQPTAATPKGHATVEQAGHAATQDAGRTTDASAPRAGTREAAVARAPPTETRWTRAVRVAAADAVPRQAGLAPLMADVREVVERLDTPPEVRQAGKALLARMPRAFEISTPQGLRRAVERSGVFLEARLARSAEPALEGAPAPRPPDADMKAALLVFRGALSAWLARAAPAPAPVEAHAEPAPQDASFETAPGDADEPQRLAASPPQAAAPRGPATTTDRPSVTPAGAELPEAGETPPDEPATPPVAAKAGPPRQDEAVDPHFAAFLATPKPVRPPPAKSEPSALGLLGLMESPPVSEEARAPAPELPAPLAAKGYGAALPEPGRPNTPPPPFAGGPMAGQRPAASDLPPNAPPQEAIRRLLKAAGAALARQDLMQIASLPEIHHDPETGEVHAQPGRLNLEVPFVTPQGVAVAQFEIDHDGGGAGGGGAGLVERTYRVRFSIDIEPLGPVHALVTLTGARARVSLWAERADTIARLRAGEESLGAALRQAELSPEVAIHSGAPPIRDAGVLGHFVDQAS